MCHLSALILVGMVEVACGVALEQKLPNGRMLMPNGGQVAFEDSAVLNFALFESMHRDNVEPSATEL